MYGDLNRPVNLLTLFVRHRHYSEELYNRLAVCEVSERKCVVDW